MKRIKNILKYFIGLTIAVVGLFVLIAFIKSPGTIEPLLNDKRKRIEKSINDHSVLKIGKHYQHLTIRGIDSTKEIMLLLHGGPGNSINADLRHPDLILEQEFVMVHWDQLGAGRSYSDEITTEEIAFDSMVTYAVEVSKYLMTRFGKKKIHLLGHSWGTHFGLVLVNEHPEYFHSYLGMAQTSNLYEAEKMSFDWIKEKAIALKDKKGERELSSLSFPEKSTGYDEWIDSFGWTHRSYINKYEGIKYGKKQNMLFSLLYAVYQLPDYTLKEKVGYIKGLQFSLKALWQDRMERDMFNEIDSIQIPVIIVQGLQDYNIPHKQAKRFFDGLKAPYKQFYTFEYSAHSPSFEEVDKFNEVIRKEYLH